jgi:O-antigen ligase
LATGEARVMMGIHRMQAQRELAIAGVGVALLWAIGGLIWNGMATSVAVAGLCLGIAVLVAAATPAAGIAVVLMAIPTMYQLHALPWGSFSLLELAILASACGLGVNLFWRILHGKWEDVLSLLEPAQIVVPVAMLVLATGISLVTLADPTHRDASLREVRIVIIEPLIFLATARIAMRWPSTRNVAGGAFVATGAAVAAYGLAQAVFDFGGVSAGSVMRATGPYPHPNNLAFFLERTLLFTIAVVLLRPRWWPVWILAAIQLAGVGATYSRGALLSIAGGVAVLLLMRGMYRWLLGLIAVGAAVLGGAFLLAPDRLIDAGGSGTEPTRFTIWRASLRMAVDHPVFGVGPDQFLYQYWRRYVEPMGWPERYTSHPHNLVLDVWLRLGVTGLAAFGSLVVGVLWWIKGSFTTVRNDIWAMGAIAALVGGVAHGLVDNGFFLPDLATMTWFFVAMVITICPKPSPRDTE